MVLYPFRHLGEYDTVHKGKRSRNVFRLLAGYSATVPAVIFLCVLLSGADMVFRNMLSVVISKFLNPVTLFMVVIQTVFWSLAMCLVCSAYGGKHQRQDGQCTQAFAGGSGQLHGHGGFEFYLVFCVIQIVYLYGKGQPAGGDDHSQ